MSCEMPPFDPDTHYTTHPHPYTHTQSKLTVYLQENMHTGKKKKVTPMENLGRCFGAAPVGR